MLGMILCFGMISCNDGGGSGNGDTIINTDLNGVWFSSQINTKITFNDPNYELVFPNYNLIEIGTYVDNKNGTLTLTYTSRLRDGEPIGPQSGVRNWTYTFNGNKLMLEFTDEGNGFAEFTRQ